jgi:hypothetical protein
MKNLEYFTSNRNLSVETAVKLNNLVDELKRLQNVSGSNGILVSQNANGIFISIAEQQLEIDDKQKLDENYNNSTKVQRNCDTKLGDIADQWRVRATTEIDPQDSKEILYRLMFLLNRLDNAGEGGWVTDAGRTGLAQEEGKHKREVATPKGRIGQLGDIVILDEGDLIAVTKDGDNHVYTNIRHDAHFLKTQSKDGRLHLTDEDPGIEPSGIPMVGDLVCDPAVANEDSLLGKESGQWRPQISMPVYGAEFIIFPGQYNGQDMSWPPFTYCPGTKTRAAKFTSESPPPPPM